MPRQADAAPDLYAGAGPLAAWVRDLYPGYFALVMATGIVSNAFWYLEQRVLSDALLAVNLLAYPLLVAATVARALRFPRTLWRDLLDPRLVFAFFTLVAASNVFGLQLIQRGHDEAARALWLFALGVWVLLSYFSFSVLTFLNTAHGANVVHGGWLIAIVGTHSLVLLGGRLAPAAGEHAATMFVAIHMLWGLGVVLYGIFVTLFSYRIFFLDVSPDDLSPLLWVVMGAAAIGVNAGSTLIMSDPNLPFLLALRPLVDGTMLILWAWATWWIPLLVIFGLWKHGVCRVPLRYQPMLWSLVFPLGMYALATYRFALASDFPPLQAIARVMVWVAFAVWCATLLGMLVDLARRLRA